MASRKHEYLAMNECKYPGLKGLAKEEVELYRKERGIIFDGDPYDPYPVKGFTGFPDYVARQVLKAGFVRPSPIQSQVWPIASAGRDLLGVAETGSGKTLAYLLPAILHINSQPYYDDGPTSIVLAPTRVLAREIQQECTRFCGPGVSDSFYLGGLGSYDWASVGKGLAKGQTFAVNETRRRGFNLGSRVTFEVVGPENEN